MSHVQIVWFRRDLRVFDHPALSAATADHGQVLPLYIFDPKLFAGKRSSSVRSEFLLGCLADLDASLTERGAPLQLRIGDPQIELLLLCSQLAKKCQQVTVHWTSDASPLAVKRDRRVREQLIAGGHRVVQHPGQYVANPAKVLTQAGRGYTVFSPFHRSWQTAARRQIVEAPKQIVPVPGHAKANKIPALKDFGLHAVSTEFQPIVRAGEWAAFEQATSWLSGPVGGYAENQNRLAGGTSELSAHLRFGTVSPLWLEQATAVLPGEGPAAFARQLAWRDFFAHVYLFNPQSRLSEFQPRYKNLQWECNESMLACWQSGQTGYPLVDAAMRQLNTTGWMHNRARMVVGSFLTKDLHLNWRLGEAYFWQRLLDAEPTQNDGNWQWIASVGVDPKPYFQRMFNPTLQAKRFDPEGAYIKRWLPELANVPTKLIAAPWLMSKDQQSQAGCELGADYPFPIVDHKVERERAAVRYRAVSGQ